jgi:hypothetical protein
MLKGPALWRHDRSVLLVRLDGTSAVASAHTVLLPVG